MSRMEHRYGQIDRDYAIRLATTPPEGDGPVWMLNLMKYRAQAEYADCREDAISGREADERYAPVEQLAGLGARIVLVADVERQFLGQPTWDRVAMVKYPTRRSFIELQSTPGFAEKHAHKDAGMEQTVVLGCQPLPPPPVMGEQAAERADWSAVEFPPTAEDGPIVVLHVIRFAREEGAEAGLRPGYGDAGADHMSAYQSQARIVAGRHGAFVAGFFDVEGTIIGDGRAWDQARFIAYPSMRSFMAVVRDPSRQAAEKEHRTTAIADTFTMVLRPRIDLIAESIAP